MHLRAAPTLITLLAALAAPGANALGFGRVVNATQLGQALNFAAVLNLDGDETLARECVSAEVFSGDNKLQPNQVRVSLEGGGESRERSVRVTSAALIDEPVLTVAVTLGCNSKVTRRFVMFIDPPTVNLAQAGPGTDSALLGPQRADSQLAPLLAIVQGAGSASSRASNSAVPGKARNPAAVSRRAGANPGSRPSAGPRDAGSAPRQTAARKEERVRKPAAARLAASPPLAPRVASGGPRLQLETTPTLVARAASAATEGAAPALPPAAASVPDEQALALARERQRIVALEEGLARLRSDSAATNKALAGLQARLKEAESERYANPLVYGLAWLSGLLMLAVAALWWRQARSRSAAQWWVAPDAARPGMPADSNPSGAAAETSLAAAQSQDDTGEATTAFDVAAVSAPSASNPAWVPRPPIATPALAVLAEPTRELSVEELIDLEQQAEFFVVLGQDEAAIDLLMSHVRSDGGISPLPYLKLLEIYRRRGENDAYERIRERFNRRFNAYAPGWDSDLQQGRSLEDYPDIVERLNALWTTPARVMETLDASLFRRNMTDETFDLPAYRELLFLYSIARDLAEHGASEPGGDVDLLLPLAEPEASAQPASRLLARPDENTDFANSDMMTMPLDLDVSFAAAPNPSGDGAETTPAALRRVPGQRFGTESGFLDFNLGGTVPGAGKPGKTGSSSNR